MVILKWDICYISSNDIRKRVLGLLGRVFVSVQQNFQGTFCICELIKYYKPGMVVHSYKPSYSGG